MVKINLPYGKTGLGLELPEHDILTIVKPREKPESPNVKAEIKKKLLNPAAAPKLRDIAKGKKNVVIVVNDQTRPTPTQLFLPSIMKELSCAGVEANRVTILVATGVHRKPTKKELNQILGGRIVRQTNVVCHDPLDREMVRYVGATSYGTKLFVNKQFLEADLRILTGEIAPHYFAGYSGGGKSIIGVCGRETIEQNHSLMVAPKAVIGCLSGNPVHEDIVEVAQKIGVDFILNVVTNSRREIVHVFAGDLIQAYQAGVSFGETMYGVDIPRKADIVVVSAGGYPRDIDLYQAQKALYSASLAVRDGGSIVLVAECGDGHGNKEFYNALRKTQALDDIIRRIERKFVLGVHKAYVMAKILKKANVIMVSELDREIISDMWMIPALNLDEAVKLAKGKAGDGKIIVMPQGGDVIPSLV